MRDTYVGHLRATRTPGRWQTTTPYDAAYPGQKTVSGGRKRRPCLLTAAAGRLRVPQNALLFVLLNVYGLGAGIAGVGLTTSYNQVFGVADPTSTQTVWAAQYAGVTPRQVMVRTLPYVWFVALGGFSVTAALYL
jgi:hypothetical protein